MQFLAPSVQRLWQPRKPLFWLVIAFNVLSSAMAWGLHMAQPEGVVLVVLTLLAPAIQEVHFFCIHRLIHVPILYKWIHSVHHNSVNPSPWSSLSMHPVEGFLYHAVAFWHLLIPSNPLLAMYQLHLAGFGAVNGHIGFDKLELTSESMAFTKAEIEAEIAKVAPEDRAALELAADRIRASMSLRSASQLPACAMAGSPAVADPSGCDSRGRGLGEVFPDSEGITVRVGPSPHAGGDGGRIPLRLSQCVDPRRRRRRPGVDQSVYGNAERKLPESRGNQ